MIRELEIIFGHHPIALHLGVACERLVFLVKLAGIAAGAIVEAASPFQIVRTILRPGAAAAAPAAVLTIVDQLFAAFVTGGMAPLLNPVQPGNSPPLGLVPDDVLTVRPDSDLRKCKPPYRRGPAIAEPASSYRGIMGQLSTGA
jgi:hypothetical protein